MATSTTSNGQAVSRTIAGGPIIAELKDGILRARGIRYATARRFQVPTSTSSWTEPVDCTKPGAVCPQLPSRLSVVIGDVLVNRSMNEDCLFLSVTAPETASKLPVMVWFHGGAFMSGGGDLEAYDPTGLARRGIVVVNVSYRLGIFGQLEIPGIAPANLGLRDQIMALRWVRDNISHLGGDPENVTIFGQSAGADSCYYLLLADGTENLFRRAILQSTPFGSHKFLKDNSRTLGYLASEALKDKAQTISTDELLKIQGNLAKKGTNLPDAVLAFSPSLDSFPLPKASAVEGKLRLRSRQIPVMIGWTAEDSLPFVQPVPKFQGIRAVPFAGKFLFASQVRRATETQFESGSRKLHELWLENGGKSTTFTFEYFPNGNPLRASHCIDLAFLLGNWDYWKSTPVMQGIDQATYDRLGDGMKDTWAGFAKGFDLSDQHLSITADFVSPR